MKYFQKYFIAHQYMPKIFHDPCQNPLDPLPTYFMYGPSFVFDTKRQCNKH